MTSTQPPSNGRHARDDAAASGSTPAGAAGAGGPVPSVPLSAETSPWPGEASLGTLVRDASTQMSTLVRSEFELAKAEATSEARKGLKSSAFFIAAAVVLLYSVFFLFFGAAQALDLVLPEWAAFLVTFAGMALVAGVLAVIGLGRARTIRKPERTVRTLRESVRVLSRRGAK